MDKENNREMSGGILVACGAVLGSFLTIAGMLIAGGITGVI